MTFEERLPAKAIDISQLPATKLDTHAPLWWGNLLGLAIETVAFGVLIAAYFTVWMTTSPFPPPHVNQYPINLNPVPDLTIPTINLAVFILSLVPDIWLDVSARAKRERAVKILLPVTLAFNVVTIVLRFYEFDSLYFRWDDNAYASVVWAILFMHMIHLFIMAIEDIFEIAWITSKGLDEKQALHITVVAGYYYWIVGIWIPLYVLVYLLPRLV